MKMSKTLSALSLAGILAAAIALTASDAEAAIVKCKKAPNQKFVCFIIR